MIIIIDTREPLKTAYAFSQPTARKMLSAGDYSIQGYENKIAIERKTLDDFIQSVTKNKKRFYKELSRLAVYDFACIVVEGNINDVTEHDYKSLATPQSIRGQAIAIYLDFNIPVFWLADRQHSAEFTEAVLCRLYKTHSVKAFENKEIKDKLHKSILKNVIM